MKRLQRLSCGRACGMTLVELMVVTAIMLILLAISVPVVKPMLANRKTAEGARTLDSFLNRARIRAIETGRPCGVLFERYTANNDAGGFPNNDTCVLVRQVEQPPPYCGSSTSVRVAVGEQRDSNGQIVHNQGQLTFRTFKKQENGFYVWNDDTAELPYWKQMVEVGDVIQFDHSNKNYYVVSVAPPRISDVNPVHWGTGTPPFSDLVIPFHSPATFKVFRKPRPTLAAPVGFPIGVVVDLEYSGVDNFGETHNDAGDNPPVQVRGSDFRPLTPGTKSPVAVMFSPSGEIDSVVNDDKTTIPTSAVHFLVGHWERTGIDWQPDDGGYRPAPYLPEDNLRNFQDPSCFWVSVYPRTGLVRTNEVAVTQSDARSPLFNSRQYANDAQFNAGGP